MNPRVAFLLVGLHAGCASTAAPGPTPVGQAHPQLGEVELLDGTRRAWTELTEAHPRTVLAFATTWCEACAREWPELLAWVDARPDTGLVYVVSGSPPAKVRESFQSRAQAASRAVVIDGDGRWADRFGVTATPTLFLLDRKGNREGPLRHLPETSAVEDAGRELGTSYAVRIELAPGEDPSRGRADLAAAREMIPALEAELSEWKEGSALTRLNRHRQVRTTPHLETVLQGALHVAKATQGAFDPTWASLSEVWEAAVRTGVWPTPEALAGAQRGVGVEHVLVSSESVRLAHPSTQVGLGGVAKGYIVDQLFLFLRERGHAGVTVNIGGDLRTSTETAVEIAHPAQPGRAIGTLGVRARALATSGNQLRRRRVGDRWVGHVLDPRSGRPASFAGTVTVLARDAAMADALATGLLVMGPEAGIDFAYRTPGVDVVYATEMGLRGTLKTTAPVRKAS